MIRRAPRDNFKFSTLRFLTSSPETVSKRSRIQHWLLLLLRALAILLIALAFARPYNYPFLYVVEPGQMDLSDEEVKGAKKYMDNGGFVLVDDFWGNNALDNLKWNFKRIYPEREFVELDITHPIFHMVYEFEEKPQVPAINVAINGRYQGITWEFGEEGRIVHYQAMYDEKGRMCALLCHNTDLGDGWEREGESKWSTFLLIMDISATPMS